MNTVIRKVVAAGTLFLASFVAGAPAAMANDGYLVINTIALHFENFEDRNALTAGVGYEYSPSSKIGWHTGTLSDSFGYLSGYGGINYATRHKFNGKLRFIIGATLLHKQFKKNGGPETKLLPFPAMEYRFNNRAVLNISGSPQVDFGNHRNNAVMFFQLKLATG